MAAKAGVNNGTLKKTLVRRCGTDLLSNLKPNQYSCITTSEKQLGRGDFLQSITCKTYHENVEEDDVMEEKNIPRRALHSEANLQQS